MAAAGDVDAFAAALRQYDDMSNTDVAEMGRAGRSFVEANFSRERYLEGLLDIYGELGAVPVS